MRTWNEFLTALQQQAPIPDAASTLSMHHSSDGSLTGSRPYAQTQPNPAEEYKKTYVHPDLIWKAEPEITFFYSKSGNLWTFPGKITHQQALIGKKLNEIVEPPTASMPQDKLSTSDVFRVQPGSTSWVQPPNRKAFYDIFGPNADIHMLTNRKNFTSAALLGRTGGYNGQKYASFWNSPDDLVKELMLPCLKKLIAKNIVGPNYLVSHPSLKDIPIGEILQRNSLSLTKDVAAEEWERKAREMHTLPGNQKRIRMKELGVGGGGSSSSRTAYQQAMVKTNTGYHAPWRGTSESLG